MTLGKPGLGNWRPDYWIVTGLFSATAFMLVLPTGAASASILLVCSVVYLLRHGSAELFAARLTIRERWFLASMTLYPISVLLSVLGHPQPVAWHYFDTPLRFLLALPIYWAIRQSRVPPVGLVAGSIAGAAGAGVLAIAQWSLHDVARPGGFANPIPFADIALLLVVVAAAPIRLPTVWRALRPVGLGLGMAAVMLAQTRGAWLAIPFLALLALQWYPGRWSTIMMRLLTAALIGCLLGIVMLVVLNRFDLFLDLLHDEFPGARIASLVIRIETWSAAWTLFTDRPWTGVGIGQFGRDAGPLLETASLSAAHLHSARTHAHSDFLHLGATMGLPGISAYLLPLVLIYVIGRYLGRQGCRTMGIMLQLFAVGQGIFSLTQTQLSHNVSATFFAVMAAATVALGFNEHHRMQESKERWPCRSSLDRSPEP